MRIIRLGILAGILATYLLTIAIYPSLPEIVASHWNASGMTDGYMPKFWGLVITPLIMTACVGLFALLPRIDPKKKNYEKFRNYYDGFILIFVLFLLAIQVQMILWNIGYQISPNLIFPILFGILFIAIGSLIEHSEPNWFAGIRTPWTMSNKRVWKRTNVRGGKLFKFAGIISFFGILAGDYALWFILAPVLIVMGYTVIYSYLEYRNEL